MDSKLSEDKTKDIKEMFDLFDEDKSGKLSRAEIAHVLRGTGMNPVPEELEEMFKSIDKDGSGEIDFYEFQDYYLETFHQSGRNEQTDLREAFKVFDKDKNGYLDIEELKDVLMTKGSDRLTDDEVKEMFSLIDDNGNGMIEYEEFVNLLNQQST